MIKIAVMNKTYLFSVLATVLVSAGLIGLLQNRHRTEVRHAIKLHSVADLSVEDEIETGLAGLLEDRMQQAMVHIHASQTDQEKTSTAKLTGIEWSQIEPASGADDGLKEGLGLIVGSDGYILTSLALVEKADRLDVVTSDGTQYEGAVAGVDEQTNLALLRIPQRSLATLRFADSKGWLPNTPLLVFEPPLETGFQAGQSEVLDHMPHPSSDLWKVGRGANLYQQGAVLATQHGDLLGFIPQSGRTNRHAAFEYAVPTRLLNKVIRELLDYGVVQWNTSEIIHKERKETLGPLGADFAAFRNDRMKGVQVKKLYPGKLRQYTEIRPGFVITKVDGRQVNDLDELACILIAKKGGVMVEGYYEGRQEASFYAFKM